MISSIAIVQLHIIKVVLSIDHVCICTTNIAIIIVALPAHVHSHAVHVHPLIIKGYMCCYFVYIACTWPGIMLLLYNILLNNHMQACMQLIYIYINY